MLDGVPIVLGIQSRIDFILDGLKLVLCLCSATIDIVVEAPFKICGCRRGLLLNERSKKHT